MSDRTEYLVVPGWQGSGPDHWQSHWQTRLADSRRTRVNDWHAPDREDWVEALHHLITSSTASRVVLIAHSLGCVTVAHWAQRHGPFWGHRVAGALLVAPADVERPGVPAALRAFAPIPREVLPFPSVLVGSTNDRAASAQRSQALADDWGSDFELLDDVGHINVASGHHHWREGLRYLERFRGRRPSVQTALLHGIRLSPNRLSV